jgi:LysM repeat protein
MKINFRIKALLIIIIMFISFDFVHSQVVVERSKERVIISGVQYYIHRVNKGETAYSISRAYEITVETLMKENPPAVYGINEGQILRIPVSAVGEKTAPVPFPERTHKDETKFIYHNLKPGETVFSLSRAYGVSENEIIQSNPGIEINKLPVGAEIAVPRREFMIEKQKFADQERDYLFHKVIQGETLASIADKYGLPLRELRRENRNLRFPQVGDFVRIPRSQITADLRVEPERVEPEPEIPEPARKVRPSGYTELNRLNGTLNVAVLLPFYFKENSGKATIDSSRTLKGKKVYKSIPREDGYIFPPSLDFIEMFEGILLAADTLRKLGLNINIYPYDIKGDTVDLVNLLRSGRLENMDLIIGPVYSYNLTRVAAYARSLNIPVVSPVPLINNSSLANNPTLFMSHSSLEVAQKTLARKISENYDHNFVFIHSDTTGTERDVRNFRNIIYSELTKKIPFEEIRFKELIFYNRSKFGIDSINRLSLSLSDNKKNTVIIASEEAPVISETIMDIHGLSKRFNIEVYGYPFMRTIETLEPRYFFDLNILLYTPYWIDYSKNDVKQFNSYFRQKFLTEPNETSYAWQGYDITYYFLSGLALHGKDFIANPEIHNPDLLQTEFNFARDWSVDGFENHKLFLIHYTKNYDIELIDEPYDQ